MWLCCIRCCTTSMTRLEPCRKPRAFWRPVVNCCLSILRLMSWNFCVKPTRIGGLGLELGQVADWIAGSGLKLSLHKELKPGSGTQDGKLTVSLWLAGKPGSRAEKLRANPKDELEIAH